MKVMIVLRKVSPSGPSGRSGEECRKLSLHHREEELIETRDHELELGSLQERSADNLGGFADRPNADHQGMRL